jgi:photosystem II stability/assembly factor-like uncharacterized protein
MIFLMMIAELKAKTLYVVTRSTKTYRIGQLENPVVGLFSTEDRGVTWRHYGWPYTKCFSASMMNDDIYLSCGNGVLKSNDSGDSWIISTGWKMTECLKTAIDVTDPDIVYSATAYGIFRTADGGETWKEKNAGLASTFTPAVIIDRSDSRRLFCATESGIHRSENRADTWEPVALLGKGIRTIVQHPEEGDLLAVGTEDDGVFISTDHGRTWIQMNNGLTTKTVYAVAFASQNADVIYTGTFRGGIFKSSDGGKHWKAVNTDLKNLDIHALLVDPDNIDIVYAGTLNDGVWMSTNAGASWKFIGLETSQVWDMLFH